MIELDYNHLQSLMEMIIEDWEFHAKENKDYESFGTAVEDILIMNHLIKD